MNLKTILRTIIAACMILAACSSFTLAATSEVRPTVTLNYETEPEAFMPGDTGTITVVLQNMASGGVYITEDDETLSMNAYIASATIGGNNDFEILDNGYHNIGLLGPQDTIKLSFNVKAKDSASIGTHFLNLQLVGGSNMYDLNYRIPVKVDDRDLKLIVSSLPSTLMNEVSSVGVEVINRRPNDVTSVIVSPAGEGMIFTPSEFFIGAIPAGNRSTATFTLNTMQCDLERSNVSFAVSYFNGDNFHNAGETTRDVRIIDQHSLILTSLETERTGNTYTFSGDLNNFGTTDAKNVIVSVRGSEFIKPVQPYAKYFIGTLEADDFSSFELSAQMLSGNISSIPVLIEFRDPDNDYISIVENIEIDSSGFVSSNSDNKSPVAPGAVAGVFAIAIVALITYSWKKRKQQEDGVQEEDVEPYIE
ncbi:COG1361 S-layer family protein [Methanolobus halotolerans]|uniref:CARDB domain-containing protein n=1 Tax=Methanolobus halotolerans TaxID=2052935 RepID=A0A4E0QAX2_9EURY|nr:hypothetical protein [Methanolobus halotolerans]TGC09694.1 hypothetical protein CUN85_04850 [Methanolobus halotolerans]